MSPISLVTLVVGTILSKVKQNGMLFYVRGHKFGNSSSIRDNNNSKHRIMNIFKHQKAS